MINKKIKSFRFIGGPPNDIYNGFVDVFVTVENDDFEYWVEVTTPQALSSYMEKNKENFIEAAYPYIIVAELTPSVILEALESFATDREDTFWLKLFHLTVEFNIDDVNTILDRHKKRLKAEEEEDLKAEEEENLKAEEEEDEE